MNASQDNVFTSLIKEYNSLDSLKDLVYTLKVLVKKSDTSTTALLSFGEIWDDVMGHRPVCSSRKVTDIQITCPTTYSKYKYRGKLLVGRRVGYIPVHSYNAHYFNPRVSEDVFKLLYCLQHYGIELSERISNVNLKRTKFLALVKAIHTHNIFPLIETTCNAYAQGYSVQRDIPDTLIYSSNSAYALPSIKHVIDSIKLDISKLGVKLYLNVKGTDGTLEHPLMPNSDMNYVILNQLYSPLKSLLNTAHKELTQQTLQDKQVHLALINIKKDLSTFLLLNSI